MYTMRKKSMKWSRWLALALFVCGLPGLAGAEAVKISVWTHSGSGSEHDLIVTFADEFNQAHADIQAELVTLPDGSYSDQVSAAALSNQLPCVLDFDGPFVTNYAWAGYLIPLDAYISSEMKADFLPSIIKQGTYRGKLYSIGLMESGLGLWANKAYLQQAGVRIPTGVDDAWTLAEFEDALAKLKTLPHITYPLDLKINYGVGEWFTYGFSPILQSFGGDLINRNGYQTAAGVLNGPEAIKAMTWFQDLFTKGYADPQPAGDDAFYGAKSAALSLVGFWMWETYHKALGDDLILLPMPKFGPRHVTGMGSWNWGITASCQHPDQAWQFLEELHRPDNVLRFSEVVGAVPARQSAAAQSKLYGPEGPLHLYIAQLNTIAVERPVTPAYGVITAAFAEAVQNIIAGEDVKTQLDLAVEKIDANIKENEGYPVVE